jgi:hypothetical protein
MELIRSGIDGIPTVFLAFIYLNFLLSALVQKGTFGSVTALASECIDVNHTSGLLAFSLYSPMER